MNFLIILLTSLLVIVSVLLIISILLQNPEDEGSYGTLSNNSIHHMISAAHIPTFLERVTRILAILFLLLVLSTSYTLKNHYQKKSVSKEVVDKVDNYIIVDNEERSDSPS